MASYTFRLYVAGRTARSEAALVNLRTLCESRLKDDYELEIVDVAEQPHLAETERIFATPTVIRLAPAPQVRIIGDLSDHHRAALFLGLPQAGSPEGWSA